MRAILEMQQEELDTWLAGDSGQRKIVANYRPEYHTINEALKGCIIEELPSQYIHAIETRNGLEYVVYYDDEYDIEMLLALPSWVTPALRAMRIDDYIEMRKAKQPHRDYEPPYWLRSGRHG